MEPPGVPCPGKKKMEVLRISYRCLTQHWCLNSSKHTSYDVIWVSAAIPVKTPTSGKSHGKHQDTYQGLYIMPQASLAEGNRTAGSFPQTDEVLPKQESTANYTNSLNIRVS